jgi:putative DNA methylase
MSSDRRLIEDYLPIQAISAEASREKSVRKGHISTLHLWWARRPLVACRAAVYGALVPASRFVPENGPENKKQSLGRANAAKFVARLCRYPSDSKPEEKTDIERAIKEAQRHILGAHAERLTAETGKKVTVEDIEAGRAPRPKVLDMFAGGGAIPLEALRLGCEAYALDLNPVAHIIELCTLVYPQKYGKPDPTTRGMTGAKNAKGETTWGGLAAEVRYWGNWVLEKVKAEIGDLYPPLPDPEFWGVGDVGRAASPAPQAPSHAGPTSQAPLFPSLRHGVAKTRRHLPHWEKEGACYFVTYRVREGIELPDKAKDIVLENWKRWSGERYDLWQIVVMSNHVHILLSPLPKEGNSFWTLSEILHTAKSYTANEINKTVGRSGALWQEERFDHIVRSPVSFEEKWHYIRQNACKVGLVSQPEEYPWLCENAGLAGRPTLTPVAYLWTRTVTCKNPHCCAAVPLAKQTWLCKKPGRYVALKIVAPRGKKEVRFEVVEASSENALGFDPTAGSKGGNATCSFCGTVADSDYVKQEGLARRMVEQLMAVVAVGQGKRKVSYISASELSAAEIGSELSLQRIADLCSRAGITEPDEPIEARMTGGICLPYGLTDIGKLHSPRQMLFLLALVAALRDADRTMRKAGVSDGDARALLSYLAIAIDRVANYSTTLCVWRTTRTCVLPTFSRQALQMVWDFGEMNPFAGSAGDWQESVLYVSAVIEAYPDTDTPASVVRASATTYVFPESTFDAVITDPPYYDNVDYAKLSDFFYAWLKRSIGSLYPEHFAASGTPKKQEAVADPVRHGGSKAKARAAYEGMIGQSFANAAKALKPDGEMTVVYAHKTTLGWATLVDALRRNGLQVTEAWSIDTEMTGGMRVDTASLSSSIFLVARKRHGRETGQYESAVKPELEEIIRERVGTLWEMGISGADLVIACVGAGLQAFTMFARVEYANGEEVPAERFLSEVETVVLESILACLSEEVGGNGGQYSLGGVDPATRFYILWRYTYGPAELDAGEAIVFANGTHVELDGPGGLSVGRAASPALIEKKKAKYRLRDHRDRGNDAKLGIPDSTGGTPVPLIDVLHRTLWLMENRPGELPGFLKEAQPNLEQMRLVAQALTGPALKGGELANVSPSAELAALGKLTANWRSVIEDATVTAQEREDARTGQLGMKL